MADMNSSLIGFLKKKSLFANSPQKNKLTRQLSRDDKKTGNSQRSHKLMPFNPERNYQHQYQPNNNKNPSTLQKNNSTHNILQNNTDNQSASVNSMGMDSPIRYQQAIQQQQKYKLNKRNFALQQTQQPKIERERERYQTQQHPQMQIQDKDKQQEIKNIWTGVISKAITFQSARIQSAQCLDNMALKLQTQISSINYKIDAFRSKMSQILDQQFANLRDRINYMVDKIIEESQKNIKLYIKQQQSVLASDLIATREHLIKQYQKVQSMKEEINKPNWRKVAGQLLSTQLEQKVDQMILKSKSLSVKHWELKNFGEEKLPALERQIRNVANLGYT